MFDKPEIDPWKSQYRDSSRLDIRILLHERYSENKYGLHRWVFDQLKLRENAIVLELGCGSGMFWRRNSDRIPKTWSILISDLSHGMSVEAKEKISKQDHIFMSLDVDAEAIPFENEMFDAVIANHMLYHVNSPRKTIVEIDRVLKTGGKLFAVTNGKYHFQELWEAVSEFSDGSRDILDRRPRNLFSWDEFSLENGEDQLRVFFQNVTVARFIDSLQITEVQELADWLGSLPGSPIENDKFDEFVIFLEEKKAGRDSFNVKKDIGLFVAQKTNDG